MKLQGKVALITGGGGAMGGAQARLFAREGAAVCVGDLFLDKAEQVADEVRGAGGQGSRCGWRCQSSAEWAAAVAATEAAFGPISILCNNAGANVRVGFDEQTEEMWNLILGTILTGSFLGPRPSCRRCGAPAAGVIVNLGSLASIRSGGDSPGYGAGKMGLVALTRATAASYAARPDSVRAGLARARRHAVSSGQHPAYSPNDERTSLDNPQNYQRRLASMPLGRLQNGRGHCEGLSLRRLGRRRDDRPARCSPSTAAPRSKHQYGNHVSGCCWP